VPAQKFGMNVRKTSTGDLVELCNAITEAARAQVPLDHPDSADLAYYHGTILTDDDDAFSETPASNFCVFADREVDRSPCGSGTTARVAVQHARGLLHKGQSRGFESAATGSVFTAKILEETQCGEYPAIVVEIAGNGYYTGSSTFTMEEDDMFQGGFLLK